MGIETAPQQKRAAKSVWGWFLLLGLDCFPCRTLNIQSAGAGGQ